MSKFDIIRAWKDEEYRNSLSDSEKAQLPENPAGVIEFDDGDMSSMSGGFEVAHPTHTDSCKHCCPPPKDTFSFL
ncbi:MAG: mersacidin/lichenicidin family type 2 lantibiotic [Cyanobacteria bacterium P01_H01_bin.35]